MDEEKSQLIERVKNLREEILALVMEREDIILQKNPAIQADYMVKVGAYEVKAAEEELSARRAKRKLEMCQAKINSGQEFVDEEIEDELDIELEKWTVDLKEKQMQFYSLLDRRSNTNMLNLNDSKNLKSLYRKLCKRLHPDLNPLLSDEERNLFTGVQKAYERGDVSTLKAYAWILNEDDAIDDESKDTEELIAEVALLEAQLEVQKELLESVKKSHPYNLIHKLEDVNWVFEKVQSYKAKAKEFHDARITYEIKAKSLIAQD